MYIVAIAWLYVTLLMAFTESSITAGILTFLFYGLLPCALFIWIVGTPQRRRNRLRAAQRADEQQTSLQNQLDQPDGSDPQRD
ncbi:MAG: hypothetical protein CVU15_07945 [Betaproteobacteria bacterium HGW-Betaproteobacteria-1]|jgi:hypothetical protein|nr:MAG: hypothetical protein CVU15_07945 [Betaproteobacteria bacterium HGW-Betaproteobacteria-1]